MRLTGKVWGAGLILALLGASTLNAQSTSATLSGTVQDQKQAVIPAAHISILNTASSFRSEQDTDKGGYFSVSNLPPGNYVVRASHPGFEPIEVTNVVLSANAVQSVLLTLKVASNTQNVTVIDRPSLINLSPAVSNTIDRQFVGDLPLDGRSIQSLITLSPGVQLAPIYGTGQNPGQFSVNGMRSNTNYFTIDGVSGNFSAGEAGGITDASNGATPANDVAGSFANLVSVDDLQEFQIQTSTYAPEFGRSPGAQISMVTRSGENKFHGSLFEYFRNDALDANDWFANYLDTGKAALRYNDFGGTFGGPVLIPKYNGRKHHSFFFFSYEGSRFVLPQPSVASIVPSLDARANAPTTVSKEVLSAFPKPNGAVLYTDSNGNPCAPGSALDCQANGGAFFATGYSNPSTTNVWSLRGDQNFHDKYTFFARYNRATSNQGTRNAGTDGNAAEVTQLSVPTQTLTIGTTQTLTSHLINQFTINGSTQESVTGTIQDTFGGSTPLPDSVLYPSDPCPGCGGVIVINGFTNAFLPTEISIENPTFSKNRQINGVENLSYEWRGHQLKFGADYRYLSPISFPEETVIGDYFNSVGDVYTNNNYLALVLYLQGFTSVFKTFSAYVQDTWKLNSRLTLTYGTRWELNPAPTGKHGKNPLTVQSLNQDTLDFNYLQLAPAGTPIYKTTYANFAPRIGFSWAAKQTPGHETVVRAGVGIFYDLGQNGFGDVSFPYTQQYFLGPGEGVLNKPPMTLPVPAAYAEAPPVSFTPSPANPADVTVAVPNYKLPRVYQWNLTAEQSFSANTVASVAYVASAGHDLQSITEYLFAAPGTPNVPVSANFSGLSIIGNLGVSNYNSLQAQLHSRFGGRFESMASYTWSHAIDNGSDDAIQYIPSGIANPNINRGDSNYDVRNSVSEAFTYNIPAVDWHNPFSQVFKNWSLNNILSAHSALPFEVESYNEPYEVNGGYYTLRADTVPGQPQWIYGKYLAGTHNLVPGGKYLNANAFTDPPTDAPQGDLPRNSLRGFGFWQLDFGVHRQFPVTESIRFQFRAELFNIFNHPNFANPGLSGTNYVGYPPAGSPGFPLGFGEASESIASGLGGGSNIGGFNPLFQQGGPRAVQLALRLEF